MSKISNEAGRDRRPYNGIAISLMVGSLATVVLLEFINPRSTVNDFIFWPQHHFHYFLKFGANNPIAPRIMLAAIFAILSLLAFIVIRMFAITARLSEGVTPAIMALLLPMIWWMVAKRGHLGIEIPFAVLLTTLFIGCVFYLTRSHVRMPGWLSLILWTVWFCWWGYLFRSAFDPINLLGPVVAFVSGLVWSFSVRPNRNPRT